MEGMDPSIHEDHVAGKGDNSLQHHSIVAHKFCPMPQAMILQAKEAVDKEWRTLGKISAWSLTKVGNKSDVIEEARRKAVKVHFESLMEICNVKNSELERNTRSGKVELYHPPQNEYSY